jgi:hypothetical protein
LSLSIFLSIFVVATLCKLRTMRRLVFFLAGLLVSILGFSQINFERTYGGADFEQGYSAMQTSDGGYVLVGNTGSYGVGAADVYLVKTDVFGDTLWTQTYGGPGTDYGYDIAQTIDSGYIIVGYTESYGSGDADVYLIKTDYYGNALWTKVIGGTAWDVGKSVIQTSDGGYIVAGKTNSYGKGFDDVYLIRTNASGDTLWTRTYGGPYSDVGESVFAENDSTFVIIGVYANIGISGNDVFLIKIDADGDTIFTRTYGGSNYDMGYSGCKTFDGGFIISGRTSSFGDILGDVLLIKTNSLGDTLWTRFLEKPNINEGRSIEQTSDSGYIIAGITDSSGNCISDVYLIKTDAIGDTLWTRTFGDGDLDYGYSVSITDDGGFLIGGYKGSSNPASSDMYLIKTNSNGIVGIEDVPKECHKEVQLYPNPTASTFSIHLPPTFSNPEKLEIFNNLGQMVGRFDRVENIDISGFPSGLYFVVVTGEDGERMAGRVVKE